MNFYWHVCQKRFLRVWRKVLREYTSFEETCYLFRFSQTLSEIFGNFHKKLAWFSLIYPMCPETISEEKIVFLFFFSLVSSDFQRNCLDYWKKVLLIGNTLFHVSRGLSERKNFHQFFFSKFFSDFGRSFPDLWRTFDRQGLQISIFFARGTLWRGAIFSKWTR